MKKKSIASILVGLGSIWTFCWWMDSQYMAEWAAIPAVITLVMVVAICIITLIPD